MIDNFFFRPEKSKFTPKVVFASAIILLLLLKNIRSEIVYLFVFDWKKKFFPHSSSFYLEI